MNAEDQQALKAGKKSKIFFWRSLWLGFWRIVALGATLLCIYYLSAVWGVILLAILIGRQVRAALHWEAQRRP